MRILVLVALLAGNVSAEERTGIDHRTWGAGTSSCGEWTQSRKDGDWHNKGQWLLGYVSADSFYRSLVHWKPAVRPDGRAIAAWVDSYCSENPLHKVKIAVRALIKELVRRAE
jgi:hypothetical protein